MSKITQISAVGSKKPSWYFYHIWSNNNVYVSFIALAEFLSHNMYIIMRVFKTPYMQNWNKSD